MGTVSELGTPPLVGNSTIQQRLGHELTIQMGTQGKMHLKKMRNVATVAQLLLSMSSIATRSSVDDPITNYTRSTGNDDPNNMASTVHTIISNTNNETNL